MCSFIADMKIMAKNCTGLNPAGLASPTVYCIMKNIVYVN